MERRRHLRTAIDAELGNFLEERTEESVHLQGPKLQHVAVGSVGKNLVYVRRALPNELAVKDTIWLHYHLDFYRPVHHQQQNSEQTSSSSALAYHPPAEEEAADWVEELIEQELHGTIVLGHDGHFYVSVEDELDLGDIDLNNFNSFIVDDADGEQTLIFEENAADQQSNRHVAESKIGIKDDVKRSITGEAKLLPRPLTDNDGLSLPMRRVAAKEMYQTEELALPATTAYEVVVREEVFDYDTAASDYDTFAYNNGQRRPRVHGHCRCMECGQTFINMARLERHLAVHQQHGSYLCPLCGKIYKYEYNLFFHWRKTCREMNDLLTQEERKFIEINALRQLVEEIAQKKESLGPLELGGVPSSHQIRDGLGSSANPVNSEVADKTVYRGSRLTAENLFGGKVASCDRCQLSLFNKHLPNHLALHNGERLVDARSVGGAFFCDLCALMFRKRVSLIKHWRTGCIVIQENLPQNSDLAMDDAALKQMVVELLGKLCEAASKLQIENSEIDKATQSDRSRHSADSDNNNLQTSSPNVFKDASVQQQITEENSPHSVEEWAQREGIFFANDFSEENTAGEDAEDDREDVLLITDEGKLISRAEKPQRLPSVPLEGHINQMAAARPGMRAVRGEDGSLRWIQYSQSVQCNECYRSFSSVQRLEKHIAGTHCSFGTHHCLLCGSRFKYEYNLLFHYRHVCPYTLEMLSRETLLQLEAVDLRKTVRQLASSSVNRTSLLLPPTSSTSQSTSATASSAALQQQGTLMTMAPDPASTKPELGDSVIRRQMMRKIIQKHVRKEHQEHCSPEQPYLSLPRQFTQSVARPHLPDATKCPICSIVFYGIKVLVRHLKAAHPNESAIWEPTLRTLSGEAVGDGRQIKLQPSHLATHRKRKFLHENIEENPPQLELAGRAEQQYFEEQLYEEDVVDVEGGEGLSPGNQIRNYEERSDQRWKGGGTMDY